MGQTLTHGVYLPDEGERNCYAGLAANWQLLDGAVGTVAEHTTQIAGKAPLVHTHTKADITDLLNSNFIPSANNSYDLGSSSYQWNNLYAKNYYYNGVAWGLDKSNTWSAEQIVLNNFYVVKENNYELGQSYANGNHLSGLHIKDKNGSTVGLLDIVDRSYGNTEMRIRVQQKFDPNSNNRSTNGTVLFNEMVIGIASDKTNFIGFNADLWGANKNLGTSTNKWKSFNGINPGALSLPDYNNCLDVTSEVPVASLDGNTDINLNNYISNKTGWLSVVIANTSGNFIKAIQGRAGTAAGFNASRSIHSGAGDNEYISLFMPIIAGTWKSVYIKASSLIQMRFYYCLGNV